MILRRMQELLGRLYDAPVEQDIADYLICDRRQLAQLSGEECHADEQVVLVEQDGEVRVGVYIDQHVLEHLQHCDPIDALNDDNLSDYCTALEGVSHFNYLMWCLARNRAVSLLELELQADVDTYAGAVKLLTAQSDGRLPMKLHSRLFGSVRYLPHLSDDSRTRYEAANRHAARFCRSLEEKFLRPRRSRPEAWLAELRRFFRCGYQEKMRLAAL